MKSIQNMQILIFTCIVGGNMSTVRTLIITSCTGEKRFKLPNQLIQSDFLDKQKLIMRENELDLYRLAAGEIYTGMQHILLMEGVSLLREKFGEKVIDLCVLSAGYGVIPESKMIVPYEVTFNNMKGKEIIEWSRFLNIHNDLSELVKEYDLVFFLLGDKYLKALELPFETNLEGQCFIFFASNTSRKLIPYQSPYHFIEVGQHDATSFSYGLVGLKGYLLKLLSQEIALQGKDLFYRITERPELIMELLEKYRRNPSNQKQIKLFPEETIENAVKVKQNIKKKIDFYIPIEQYAKNYNDKMQYFIPEWDDRVDPQFNFLEDTSVEGRNPYSHDVYAHEIYENPNYDGILVSKVIIEQNKTKRARIEEVGIHKFLRFDQNRPIMGDCGAFGYVAEYEPPYNTEEILNYYQLLGFNIGVSIDHLIVGDFAKDLVERQRRYQITKNNAADFMRKHKDGEYSFIPSGVAQGWDPKSYRDSVVDLIDMGYQHISLGGLARAQTRDIIEIMKQISPIVPDYLQIHLFGVARLEPIMIFRQLGITSFDSASHLRRAWLGSGSNYFSLDGNTYAAIRVPPVEGRGVRVKKMVAEGKGTFEEFKILEEASLDALRKYDKGHLGIEETLKILLEYDSLIGEDRNSHAKLYQTVLEDQPWKKCGCKICNELGIEVIIFRGNNRNRRRGFHNTYVFYEQFKDVLKNKLKILY